MAAVIDPTRIANVSHQFPKPSHFQPTYGTAGFRCEASLLGSTVFRCGLLTAARAAVLGRHCGLMITASHNPEADNGVKIVKPGGEMLNQAWEPLATELARSNSDEEVACLVQRLLQHAEQSDHPTSQLWVLVGCDTRPSSLGLTHATCEGIRAMGMHVLHLGQVTTPQLHFQVAALNAGLLSLPQGEEQQQQQQQHKASPQVLVPCASSLDLYFSTLLSAFEQLTREMQVPAHPTTLYVDCANGVGSQHLRHASARLAAAMAGLHLHLINQGECEGSGGRLNHMCGADFVQKECKAPAGFSGLPSDARCCSIDGDADRLVFFTLHAQQQQQAPPIPSFTAPDPSSFPRVSLLDGDRISVLLASFVSDLVKGLPEALARSIKVGVVQTAYANGASTHYITDLLKLEVVCTKTGVKHLHREAHAFDIGIYFEANGHGTALFSPSLIRQLKQIQHICAAAHQMLLLSQMVNQTVGDAISGILAVEAILKLKGWSISSWQAQYQDLPSKQTKLLVKDRTVVKTTDAERVALSPPELQPVINKLVAEAGDQARAFVRPSGTEDIVRVYAEARTREAADALAAAVARATFALAGGTGAQP